MLRMGGMDETRRIHGSGCLVQKGPELREGVRAVKMPSVLAPANLATFCGFDLVGVIGRTGPETRTQRPRERRHVGGPVSLSPLLPPGARPLTVVPRHPSGLPGAGWAPQERLCPVSGFSGATRSWKAITLEEPPAGHLWLICPDMVGPCSLKRDVY